MSAAVKADAAKAPPNFIPPNFEGMPAELKKLRNWVLWVPVLKGPKWTKRPIQPSGFAASTINPKHWSSFNDVRDAYDRTLKVGHIEVREKDKPVQRMPIGGVGFVFDGQQDENGLVIAGVDFDKVLSDDGIASLAEERVKRLKSYTEKSVSGCGLHVIVKAKPLPSGVAHGGVEMYTTARYFAMTGCGTENVEIIAAETQFAALAEELRAQGKSSRNHGGETVKPAPNASTGLSRRSNVVPLDLKLFPKRELPPQYKDIETGSEGIGPTTDSWFWQLAEEEQSKAVKHAALHIANNSKLFELSGHGGNYREYFKIALAIARSGVRDAEDIFIEAASKAKDADSQEELRDFFQNCQSANARADGVTVGTLFHNARQCDANFDQWKRLADGSDPNAAVFVPGNEDECRKLLDCVVAADPQTYTLGDPTGPLVILRVPDEDDLESGVEWEGDLPATTLAMPADVMQRAERLVWKRPNQNGFLVRVHPPRPFVGDYIPQMRGQYSARPLRGIVRVPRIDDDGEIRFVSGYDRRTGLFHDRALAFDVPPKPTRDDVRCAAEGLLLPFSKYKFENDKAGRALVLAAILTAIERPFLPVVPIFIVRSSMPGTGKGLIVRSLVRLAFDTVPVVVTWGYSSEEFEKRLGALLLQSPGAISIDNANGIQVKGDLLEAILTEGAANIRPLGRSETIKVRNRSFITITGNNPIITGDMARRALSLDIMPRSADPERDRYNFNPVTVIERNRTDFLRAAFTVMRAFRQAGMQSHGLPAVGSFDDWSRKVRDLVYVLTDYDVSEGFRHNKVEDPRRQGDASLLAALHQRFAKPFKAADVIAVYLKVRIDRWNAATPASTDQALYDALEDVLTNREINAKLFGYWARRVKGAHIGGFMLETEHDPATNANLIIVRKTT
jgi:putative DNA primase/helicase